MTIPTQIHKPHIWNKTKTNIALLQEVENKYSTAHFVEKAGRADGLYTSMTVFGRVGHILCWTVIDMVIAYGECSV